MGNTRFAIVHQATSEMPTKKLMPAQDPQLL
jgi:hypothetical protein